MEHLTGTSVHLCFDVIMFIFYGIKYEKSYISVFICGLDLILLKDINKIIFDL